MVILEFLDLSVDDAYISDLLASVGPLGRSYACHEVDRLLRLPHHDE